MRRRNRIGTNRPAANFLFFPHDIGVNGLDGACGRP